MSKALRNMSTLKSPVNEKALGEDQVKNNTGGYVFQVTDEQRLRRFLVLGTESGSYYVSEREMTKSNADFLINLIERDEELVAATTIEVSAKGLAKQNSPAIFAAAALIQFGSNKDRAREVFNAVVRTGTHLFEYITYVKNLGGFGRSKRNTIAGWYTGKSDDSLAYQLVKYRQREGWTHGDVLRQVHPTGLNKANAAFALGKDMPEDDVPGMLNAFKSAQEADTEAKALKVIGDNPRLPWEALPTNMHSSPEVWKALFRSGSLSGMALLRNISRLARLGALDDLQFAYDVAKRLKEDVPKARIHPVSYLLASVTYTEGPVRRDTPNYAWGVVPRVHPLPWKVVNVIAEALEDSFYESFKHVTPANKRTMLALDVSGSMASRALGIDLSCSQVSAAMAMTIARTEPMSVIRGFSDMSRKNMSELQITSRTALGDAMRKVRSSTFGSTDMSLPMKVALKEGLEIDTFVVITDNEVNSGTHPFQALKEYRRKTGIDARLAVFGVSATPFTIANPSDAGMMDFVGFDASAPSTLADFSAGRL